MQAVGCAHPGRKAPVARGRNKDQTGLRTQTRTLRRTLLLAILASCAGPILALGAMLAVFGPAERLPLVATVLVALSLSAALAGFSAARLSRPLSAFVRGASDIAAGKFGTQVRVDSEGELKDLATTFNYMSMQLLATTSEAEALYKGLEEGFVQTILALANGIDSKDSYTRGHSQRVGELAAEIGQEMGVPERTRRLLLYGGILHDVGKIGIAETILCKRTKLTEDEMKVMRRHPSLGAAILDSVHILKPVLAAVRNHHERWDGTGYPDGLKGKNIPLSARIVNCADTWDACTSTRPYQQAMPPEHALDVIDRLSGSQLDPEVASALSRVVRRKMAKGERVSACEAVAAAKI
jgi:putative nucleotidyltransferase with HDIG domain